MDDFEEENLEKLSTLKLILISIFWFSNNLFYTALIVIIVPNYVDYAYANSDKGTILGENIKIDSNIQIN